MKNNHLTTIVLSVMAKQTTNQTYVFIQKTCWLLSLIFFDIEAFSFQEVGEKLWCFLLYWLSEIAFGKFCWAYFLAEFSHDLAWYVFFGHMS